MHRSCSWRCSLQPNKHAFACTVLQIGVGEQATRSEPVYGRQKLVAGYAIGGVRVGYRRPVKYITVCVNGRRSIAVNRGNLRVQHHRHHRNPSASPGEGDHTFAGVGQAKRAVHARW